MLLPVGEDGNEERSRTEPREETTREEKRWKEEGRENVNPLLNCITQDPSCHEKTLDGSNAISDLGVNVNEGRQKS